MPRAGQETPRVATFDATAERVVRLLCTRHTGGHEDIRSALPELAARDDLVEEEVCFEETEDEWRVRVAA